MASTVIGHALSSMDAARSRFHTSALGAVLLLVALQFSLPFLVPLHRYPITTFDSEWVAAVTLGATLLVAGAVGRARLRLNWPLPAVLLLLLAIGGSHAATGMLQYTYTLSSLMIWACAMFSAYLLARWLVAEEQRDAAIRALCAGLLVGGGLSVLLQILQVFDVRMLPEWLAFPTAANASSRRPFANLAQPNHLATYLVWGTIAALYLQRRGFRWSLALAALALLFCGLALTGSRMGALFGLAVVAIVLTRNELAPAGVRRLQALGALASGYAAGTALTALFLVDSQGAMANALERFGEGSFGQRLSMWADAVRIAAAHPWLGVGVGEYGGAQYLAARPHPSLLATNNPHNVVLHLAAEFGFPAAVAIVVVSGGWLWRRVPAFKRDPAVAAAAAMILVVLGHSMLEYPLWSLFFAIPLAVLVALAEPAGSHARGGVGARLVLAPIGVAILAAAAVMKADYEGIAPVWTAYLDDVYAQRPHEPQTIVGITGTMGATYFKPQMERLYVELVPAQAQQGNGNLALVGRVLTRLADVRVMVRYIELLVQADRIDDTFLPIARLKVFAGAQYPIVRDELLDAIAERGPSVDPVRRALASQ